MAIGHGCSRLFWTNYPRWIQTKLFFFISIQPMFGTPSIPVLCPNL